nr:DNA polymerase Y family protein [Leucobacter exalbidus]
MRQQLQSTATEPPAGDPAEVPLALCAQRRIVACCAMARAAGVRAGMRERDAQAICPTLELHPHDPDRDARLFLPVLAAFEQVVTGLEARRPGLAALRARGPARYYGGEEPAAHTLLSRTAQLGLHTARIGIADGLFAAEQAARQPRAVTVVPPGESRAFLSPLPIARAAPERLAATLQGLGIHTLGAFAALPEEAVRQRFGSDGVAAHRRSLAAGPRHGTDIRPRTVPQELSAQIEFEPSLNTGAALVAAATATVTQFFAALDEAALICTGIRIELTDDTGARHERTWSHPTHLRMEDVLDRVQWQAESGALSAASASASDDRGGAGVTRLTLTPTRTDRAAAHEAGLWGSEPDERVRHHLRGIQSAHGRDSVGTASLRGGRLARHRQEFTPWGSDSHTERNGSAAGLPWPGASSAPAPGLVFSPPLPALLSDPSGAPISVTEDDLLSAVPATLSVHAGDDAGSTAHPATHATVSPAALPRHVAVTAWSSPWPVHEHWWEGSPARVRLQVVLATGDAWLLCHEAGGWLAEGRYD